MSEEILKSAIELFRGGDLAGAVADLEAKAKTHSDVAIVHHTFAEFANMLNTEQQEDVVPGGKIMMSYKKAMQLDEENVEFIADFAAFALECRRVPVAVKEFQRYAKKLEIEDIQWMIFCTKQVETLSMRSKLWIHHEKHQLFNLG
jgi:hypothetical protein